MTADDPRPAGEACACGLNLNIWQNSWNHRAGCSTRPAASGGATDGEREDDGNPDLIEAMREGHRAAVRQLADDRLRDALRIHHPIMRSETGPFSGCRCGQVKIGQDVIAHVVAELRRALDGSA